MNFYSGGNPVITDCIVQENVSGAYGGGMMAYEVNSIVIRNCLVQSNTAVEGGGIYLIFLQDSEASWVQDVELLGNHATSADTPSGGGGLRVIACDPGVDGCLFSGNTAVKLGGGAQFSSSVSAITGCSFSSNSASDGGGLTTGSPDQVISATTFCENVTNHISGPWTDGGEVSFYDDCGPDCNGNGVLDSADISNGTSLDCNANGVPDECDIAEETSSDNNPMDGIPDECQGNPSGACCFGSQCVRVTLANCSSSGGEYFGDGSNCADSPCGPSGTGACCLNGACISATLEDCFVAGGSFAGALAGCSDVSCPVECMGDTNGNGVVDIEDLLDVIGSWGPCP